MESLSDALRVEMKAWDIEVILIEPGAFHTEFQEKAYTDPIFDGFFSFDSPPLPPSPSLLPSPLPRLSPLDKTTENHYQQLIKRTNEHSAKRKRPPMGL